MQTTTNTSKTKLLIIATLAIALVTTSCSGRKSSPDAEIAKHGISISQLVSQTYQELNTTIKEQEYQKEFIQIVNDISPETYVMKIESHYEGELKNILTINAYRNLERVFAAYNLQFDSNISLNASGLQEKIKTACSSIDSLALNENLIAKNEQIKKHINSSKFKTEEIIFELTSIFEEIWKEESQKWFLKLAKYQEETDKGIKRIPTSAFNAEKLKLMVEEPYSNAAVLANLYKLKLIKENQTHVSALQEQMFKLSEAFELLLTVQGEQLKKRKDKLRVEELNNRLSLLLQN
jgi:hypothetical protein